MVTQHITKAYCFGLKAAYQAYGVSVTPYNYKHVVYTINTVFFFLFYSSFLPRN